jgi:CopG family nickel-responsive transcriptional regulator
MIDSTARFSVSLPATLLRELDAVVRARRLPNRSHAVAEMIRSYVLNHTAVMGDGLMAGVITIVYANDRSRLRGRVQDIQHRFLKEVISSQHVFLEGEQSLEALLVQGPADRLRLLADEIAACRGVHTVRLAITAALLPPIHMNEDR